MKCKLHIKRKRIKGYKYLTYKWINGIKKNEIKWMDYNKKNRIYSFYLFYIKLLWNVLFCILFTFSGTGKIIISFDLSLMIIIDWINYSTLFYSKNEPKTILNSKVYGDGKEKNSYIEVRCYPPTYINYILYINI